MIRKKKSHCKQGHPRTSDNLTSNRSCKTCSSEGSKKRYNDNPEKWHKIVDNWRKKNPGRAEEITSNWRKENSERVRAHGLAHRYGLDIELVYQYLLDRKDVIVCDICQQEEPSGRSLALDHDHKTGKIRGLLCTDCNRFAGKIEKNINKTQVVLSYLKIKGSF